MKFSARSYSPSPIRGKPRNSSTFGVQSDSDSEEYESELDSFSTSSSSSSSDANDDTVSIASTSSSDDSLFLPSEMNRLAIRTRHAGRSALEEQQIQETVAAIRLRARYYDPYEEWEKQTRRDAFKTARKELSAGQVKFNNELDRLGQETDRKLKDIHEQQLSEVEKFLSIHKQRQNLEEMKLKEAWKVRERELWQRVEFVIKLEEDKVAKKLEEERKRREEVERKRKEEETRRRQAEEKRLQEELAKRKQEEDRARKEREEEERRKKMEEEHKRKLSEEVELRKKLLFSPADDNWRVARQNLRQLKSGPMKFMKGDKPLKSEWSKLRRQIVPKIGQLTNDAQAIHNITQQIIEIVRPAGGPPRHETIYITLLSSLAKCILLQAETEVTAEKRSAMPLAQVTFGLLDTLEHFPSIFFAKLVQRCGGWPIPFLVPQKDVDGESWTSQDEYNKVRGFRKSESGEETMLEYSNRVSSMMRVFFHVLKIRPMQKPLDQMFQLPRYWTWFARLLGDPKLLADPIAPQLIYTALDVMGPEARSVWGKQWMKVLALIYEGITIGYEEGKFIGGDTPEASAARTRVMVSIEHIINNAQP